MNILERLVKKSIIEQFLCCPLHRAYPLQILEARWDGDELLSGSLRCPQCGADYPVIGGIPHLLPPGEAQAAEVATAKRREATARAAAAAIYEVPSYRTILEMAALLGALRIRPGDVIVDLGAGTGRLTTE